MKEKFVTSEFTSLGVLWYLWVHMCCLKGTWCHLVTVLQDLSFHFFFLRSALMLCSQTSLLVTFLIYFSTALFCNTYGIMCKIYICLVFVHSMSHMCCSGSQILNFFSTNVRLS
jgi:hypothetical protein